MSLNIGELNGYLSLSGNPFFSTLTNAKTKLREFGPKGAAIAAAAGVAIGGALGAAAVKEFAKFEQGMNEVFTLMPEASNKAMGQMSDDVRAFSREMGVAHSEAVPALYQALSAGVPQDTVFDFLETANKAAVGGVTDLQTAVDGISSVVNSYGDQIGGAGEASDLMFTAVKLGKTTFDELSRSLYNVLPVSSSLGVEFSDVTAAIASMTAQGVPTAQATTQIRQAFVELSKDGTATSKLFEKLSGKTFAEFIAEGGNTADALDLLAKHANKSGGNVADLFGSVEAGQAALALTGKGAEGFRDNLEAMGDSAGATDKAFGQMDQGLARAWAKIKVNLQDAMIGFGEQLAPAVQDLADWVGKHLPDALENAGTFLAELIETVGEIADGFMGMAHWINQNQEPILMITGLIAAVFLPHLAALGVASTVTKTKVVAAWAAKRAAAVKTAAVHSAKIAAMVAKMAFLGAQALLHGARVAAGWVLAMGPVGWVIATIVALVALIIANWDTVKRITSKAWGWVWGKIKGIAGAIWDSLKWYVGMWLDVIGWVASVPGKVARWFGRAKDGAIDKLRGLISWVRDLPGRIRDAVGNLGSLLLNKGKDVVRGLWDGIKSMGPWLKDTLIGWVDDNIPGPVAKALSIFSPSKVMADRIGRYIPLGIVDGIERESGSVDRAMRDLVEVPSVRMTVRGGDGVDHRGRRPGDDDPPAGGGHTIHVHESANARETANEVAVQLDHAGGT